MVLSVCVVLLLEGCVMQGVAIRSRTGLISRGTHSMAQVLDHLHFHVRLCSDVFPLLELGSKEWVSIAITDWYFLSSHMCRLIRRDWHGWEEVDFANNQWPC